MPLKIPPIFQGPNKRILLPRPRKNKRAVNLKYKMAKNSIRSEFLNIKRPLILNNSPRVNYNYFIFLLK